jgi:hypothetical protein
VTNKQAGESFLGKFWYLAKEDSKFPYKTLTEWLTHVNNLKPTFTDALGSAIIALKLEAKMGTVAEASYDKMKSGWFSAAKYPLKGDDLQLFIDEFAKYATSFSQMYSKFKYDTSTAIIKTGQTVSTVISSASIAAKIAPLLYMLVPAAIIGFWIIKFMPKKSLSGSNRRNK